MVKEILAIFVGGGVGSLLRYLVQMVLHERIRPYDFPWATLSVNLVGSFLIGLFYAWSARWHLSVEVRLLLTTGLCGGFTTFSTLYAFLSLTFGLLAVWGGTLCGKN